MRRRAKLLQAKVKAQAHSVTEVAPGMYDVTSATSGTVYRVERGIHGYLCQCEWSKFHGTEVEPCTHTLAVGEHLANEMARRLSLWGSVDDARRQHRPVERVGVGLYATSRSAA